MLEGQDETLREFTRPMEVEREFLDVLSIIVSSGYFLEQDDFLNLIEILQVSY